MDPDWSNSMGDNSRPLGEEDELVELLWCNGHVVMQSQTSHRKLPPRPEKTAPCVPAPAPAAAPEDEAGLWLPFAVPDSLDIFSDLFCEAPAAAAVKPPCETGVVVPPPEDDDKHGAVVSEAPPCGLMPPPKSATPRVSWSTQQTVSLGVGDDLSELVRAGSKAAGHQASSSTMLSAIGSSICGSNQVLVPRRAPDAARPSAVGSASASGRGGGHEAAASSSGRSNGCFGATTEPTTSTSKRKRLDSEDSESPAARKPPTKMATARRSRAAEVHNLSERRRRDRINEKLRALQELIPHCNKTDKASMLDEAIEYLKSLQQQVQIKQMMWMGSGIAAPPVMFPGVHQYLPRMPFMAPTPPVNTVPLSSAGYPRGHHVPPALGVTEPYAHYLGVNHLQTQGVGYYPLGAKAVQQNPAIHVPGGSVAAAAPGVLPAAPNRGQNMAALDIDSGDLFRGRENIVPCNWKEGR